MKSKFSLIDCVVVCCVGFAAFSVAMPKLVQSKEESKLKTCENNLRRLALATLNKESATRRFPLALWGTHGVAKIDSRGPKPFTKHDGYGYAVSLLPYMNDGLRELYDNLSEKSEKFSLPMNSTKLKADNGKWIYSGKVPSLLCPTNEEDHSMVQGKHPGLGPAQVSNYLSLVAGCVDGSRQTFGAINPTTGGMIVTMHASPKGLRIGDCKDGISKTYLLTESKAELHAFWASGVSTSTVAISPDVATCARILRNKPDGFPAPPKGVVSGLNYGKAFAAGSDKGDIESGKWFAKSVGGTERDWGPSSRHEGGRVNHAFVDGHVKAFTKDVDPTVYFRLSTRGGAEPAATE